jgi:hypothetical protein
MTAQQVSRRGVLAFAGAGLTLGIVEVLTAATPTQAAAGLRLEPVADHPVAVLSGESVAPVAYPRQLATRVIRDEPLPTGTRITMNYDPRLIAPLSEALVLLDGRPVRTTTAPAAAGEPEGRTTVTLDQVVAREGELIIVAGTAHPLLYPFDLVRQPTDPTVELARPGATALARLRKGAVTVTGSLRPPRPATFGGPATAWGIELTGVWGRQTWGADDRFRYHHPVQVTLRGVGPGRAPGPAAFGVTLDPRLVSALTVESVELNRTPSTGRLRLTGSTRAGAAYRTDWTSSIRLAPNDVLNVRFRVRTLTPPGPLPGIKHPVVSLAAMGGLISQRRTGQNELTRSDAIWQ